MTFLCPACQALAPIAAFRVEAGALWLRCARCHTERAVDAPEAALPPRPPAAAQRSGSDAPLPAALAGGEVLPGGRLASGRPGQALGAPHPGAGAQVIPLRPGSDPVQLAAESARADPFAIPEGRCPKCISPRPQAELACAQCGLIFGNFRPEEHALPEPLARQWTELLAAWDELERHDRFVAMALAHGALAAAGRLYGIRLAVTPTDPHALHGRDEVLRRASLVPQALVAQPRARLRAWQYVAVAVLLAFSAGMLVWVFSLAAMP